MSDKVNVTKQGLLDTFTKSVRLSKIVAIVEEIVDLVIEKNSDYGDAWQRYGIFTPLIRINDKLLRVENLLDGKDALVASETVADNLKDVIGYSLLALLWLDTWHKEATTSDIELPTAEQLGLPIKD